MGILRRKISFHKPEMTFSKKGLLSLGLILILIVLSLRFPMLQAQAGSLSTSSITMNDSRPSGGGAGTGVTYTATFTFASTSAIQCINIGFGSTSSNVGTTSTTPPTAMDTTSAAKVSLSGGGLTNGNWTLYHNTNGILQYEYGTGEAPTATSITITTNGITNTSTTGAFYAQIATYSTLSTHTCSGVVDSSVVMAMTTVAGVSTTVSVDPTISFSVANYGSAVNGSGDASPVTTTNTTIPFGTVAAGATAWGSHTLTTSTNATHGYNVYVRYTGQMTNANADTIRDQACASADCTTAANAQSFDGSSSQTSLAYTADNAGVSFGSNKWLGLTTTNTKIAARTSPQSSDPTHVEYKIQIGNTQPPGSYSTTVIYTASAVY